MRLFRKGGIAATLRFGHDGNVIPLVALMQIENCNVAVDDPYEVYKVWSDFKVVPMAANVQIAFFRNEKGSADDILVKILHNEHEVHIRYRPTSFLSINGAMWRVTTELIEIKHSFKVNNIETTKWEVCHGISVHFF